MSTVDSTTTANNNIIKDKSKSFTRRNLRIFTNGVKKLLKMNSDNSTTTKSQPPSVPNSASPTKKSINQKQTQQQQQSKTMQRTSSSSSDLGDSRKRQSKRDDAIRRRIEHDLNKKKKGGITTTKQRKATPGTVLALKPSEPVICKTSSTVYEVSQLMTAKRENCILVVNMLGQLLGIFTAKDLAFRVVAAGLNASSVTIDEIMTPDPICTHSNSPASEALSLMVEKGFRHLPVLDDQNQIVGVLDITKCYAQQMEKLERVHKSSSKLYEALDSVHNEIGVEDQPDHIYLYFETLKTKMSGPVLESVLDATTVPVYTNVKASVYEATVLMTQHRTTAVLVKDTNNDVAGIFTSKDVVLRVIAAGLDPKKCSIVRVMTPQPDVAKVDLPVQQALRQMFEGHYLNLPVIRDDSKIIAIVDVLKLTYITLNTIKQLENNKSIIPLTPQQTPSSTSDNAHSAEGPAWNKFWSTPDHDDTVSIHSDSLDGSANHHNTNTSIPPPLAPDVTPSEFNSFNVDIKPSDSISHIESPRKSFRDNSSFRDTSSQNEGTEESSFTFKFASPAIDGRVHRVSLKPSEGVEKLRSLMDEKLIDKDFEVLKVKKSVVVGDNESGSIVSGKDETYAISYVDDEGDVVSITSNQDLNDCVSINQKLNNDKADIYIHNPHEHADTESIKPLNKKKNTAVASVPLPLILGGLAAVSASLFIFSTLLHRK